MVERVTVVLMDGEINMTGYEIAAIPLWILALVLVGLVIAVRRRRSRRRDGPGGTDHTQNV